MQAEQSYGGGPDRAIDQFVRAVMLGPDPVGRKSYHPGTPENFSSKDMKELTRFSGREFAKNCLSSTVAVSPTQLDRFCRTASLWTDNPSYARAKLLLYTPPARDPSAALAFLRDSVGVPVDQLFHGKLSVLEAQKAVVSLGLDTAPRLLEQDRLADGEWVLQYLKRAWLEQLDSERNTLQDSPSYYERISLQLLDGLRTS